MKGRKKKKRKRTATKKNKCKYCEQKCNYIVKHLAQTKECKDSYSEEEYAALKKESAQITRLEKNKGMRIEYQKKKADIAEKKPNIMIKR